MELQKAAVFDEFDDEREVTEEQSVCSLLILLFLNLINHIVVIINAKRLKQMHPHTVKLCTHVLKVGSVDLFLDERYQDVQSPVELFPFDLHKQPTNLSSESPQSRLQKPKDANR